MQKLRYIALTLFLISCNFGLCQNYNLISNPSFERVDTPVYWNSGTFINNSHFPATRNVTNWDWYNSPDYFSQNVPYTGIFRGIPVNDFGSSNSKNGVAYAGISVYDIRGDYQEYVSQQIGTPLVHDSIYCLSFFTTRADRTPYAVKTLGAYFSISTPTLVTNQYLSATPQVVNANIFITDTVNWVEIKGCFTAQGGEQYITIGNFNNNANTDTLRIQSTNPLTGTGTDIAYYYIDSVSLWKNNFPTFIKENNIDEFVSVYPNPASSVISIKLTGGGAGTEGYRIKITDVLGREVLVSDYKEQIDISNLEKGIYLVSILQGDKTLVTKKVVKQ